jgi:hypothetical protein
MHFIYIIFILLFIVFIILFYKKKQYCLYKTNYIIKKIDNNKNINNNLSKQIQFLNNSTNTCNATFKPIIEHYYNLCPFTNPVNCVTSARAVNTSDMVRKGCETLCNLKGHCLTDHLPNNKPICVFKKKNI